MHGVHKNGNGRPVQRRRVVVTGMGALTPIGNTVGEFWAAALAGESGAALITRFDASAFDTRFACELKAFDPLTYLDRKLTKRLDPFCQYAVVAADEALRDAAIDSATLSADQKSRVGVIFGSGIGGIQTLQAQSIVFQQNGPHRLSPFFVPMMISDMASGIISIRHGFTGPNHCVVSACATGNHNIGDAMAAIRADDADIVLCGGSEAVICELGVGGFGAMKAMSTRNDCPQMASRPFDVTRDGFVMGEGAAALVLEGLEHALARGARIYAEVLSVGSSADAYHMTAPHPDGLGARLAMAAAMRDGGIELDEVDTINMHATSTALGDAAESRAIRLLFDEHADGITVTSTKSMTGHMLGAAGAAEAILSILSIVHGVVPPTINVREPDPACDLSCAFNAPVERPVRTALSNAFGFGGHNTTAAFRAYP
jgi:3-oxoacyl-[acyl-carrier-protein] synthase II